MDCGAAAEALRSCCCGGGGWRGALRRRLPVCAWLPGYGPAALLSDFIAGLSVGLTAIPQGIAYAVVAGLQPQYGLYSGFMGAFVYILLGTCKDVTIGPTAILALMSQKSVEGHGPDFAVLLCFLSGCVILLLGLLNLGFLVDFISMPVTVGFTTAAAITIASSQVKGLLGLKGRTNEFLESWTNVFEHIGEMRPWDLALGLSTIAVLLLARLLDRVRFRGEALGPAQRACNRALWLLSIGRNAVVAVVGTGMAYGFDQRGMQPFTLTGDIGEGLPPFQPPPFSTEHNNRTYSFGDMLSELGPSVATLPLISVLESIAIAKAFSKGKALDATQEMLALGACNLAGSFFRSMPTTGSFTRTAVNNASGVRTPMGGLFTGALVLLALGLLTSAFSYIPKATLAGIIIAAMFFMVEYQLVPLLWRARKLDLLPWAVTVLACLFAGLEYGILAGVGVNLLFLLYPVARPRMRTSEATVQQLRALVAAPDGSLAYPAAEHFRCRVLAASEALGPGGLLVIDGARVRQVDSTVAKNLQALRGDLRERGQALLLWNWGPAARRTLAAVDPAAAQLFRAGADLARLRPPGPEPSDPATPAKGDADACAADEPAANGATIVSLS